VQVKAVCEITPDGCWLWRYGTWAEHRYVDEQHRYPKIMIKGVRKIVAHWILEATGRPRPSSEMEACHSCHRPPCCNPLHVRWDTHQGNMEEMGECYRTGPDRHPEKYQFGDRHWTRQHPEWIPRGPRPGDYASGDDHFTRCHPEWITWRGTNHYQAVLDDDLVRDIRKRHRVYRETALEIARDLGVGRGTIRAILEGRTWKHVA
jgi:hypothetical protein